VARASGFGTRYAMSEVFRRELGVSLADYRNRAIKP
jgi:AraC-like DNA-binding protein